MKTKNKIFIGCGGAILISVLAFVGFVAYLGTDKAYSEQYSAVLREGSDFGKTTDQNGCLRQGLLRMNDVENPTLDQLSLNGRFVNECLDVSRPSPDFCKNVPKVIVRDWIGEQCRLIGRSDSVCYVVFDEKTTFCAGL